MYKNLEKLRWRSSVDVCEKRYVHIHAEKVGFLLKILHSRGNLLKNSMLMCINICYFDLLTMNHHIYDPNYHLSRSNSDDMFVKNLKDTKTASDLENIHTVHKENLTS